MNEQIEEMAKAIYDEFGTMVVAEADAIAIAVHLTRNDYRKASDVAKEILEKLVERSTFGLVDIDYAFKIAKEMGVDVKNGKC